MSPAMIINQPTAAPLGAAVLGVIRELAAVLLVVVVSVIVVVSKHLSP